MVRARKLSLALVATGNVTLNRVYRGEVVRVMLMIENKIALLTVFCFFLAIVVWLFWAYHIWLTANNMTTNESIKRGRVRGRILAAYLLQLNPNLNTQH